MQVPNKAKRTVVFYNESGGAHVSAAKVIKETLTDHDIILVNFARDFLNKVNGLAKFSGNRLGSDELYNFAMRKGLFGTINWVGEHFAYDIVGRNLTELQGLLQEYFVSNQIDLVISTIPLVNSAVLAATRAVGIPFALVTLDGDLRYWKIEVKPQQDDLFAITISLNNAEARQELIDAQFDKSLIYDAGFPIRQIFLKPYDRASLRKEMGIHPDARVVMVLMGGEGSKRMLKLIKKIVSSEQPLHVLACVGKSKTLKDDIEALPRNSKIDMTVVGFTDRIPDLMAMSDVIVTKSGPSTICESLQLKLPMIIDQRGTILTHESKHAGFVESNNLGLVLRKKKELPELINTLTTDNDISRRVKQALASFTPASFQQTFPRVIAELCAKRA